MPDERLEKMRWLSEEIRSYGDTGAGTGCGVFAVRRKGATIRIIATDGLEVDSEGWEHVSVSVENRCPAWDEMCFVKDLFWLPEEAVMQLHPPQSEYVNNHAFCLHLWKPTHGATIPLPPSRFVGIKGLELKV